MAESRCRSCQQLIPPIGLEDGRCLSCRTEVKGYRFDQWALWWSRNGKRRQEERRVLRRKESPA